MRNFIALIIVILITQTPHFGIERNSMPRASLRVNYSEQGGGFELPLNGATGWAAIEMPLRNSPMQSADVVLRLAAGQGFTIIEEYGDWWNVLIGGNDGISGWVLHRECFINLPDIIPSLVFDITNAYSSMKRSSGYAIPNITGYALYNARAFNYRLNRCEFIVPILYSTSRRIFEAQQAALADGNTIIIYEAFRPRAVQQSVVRNLRRLMDSSARVRNAINATPWDLNWFISTGISNHQRGVAVDVGLGRIVSCEMRTTGVFVYTHITDFERHAMPTQMHELSPLAATFTRPVSSVSPYAWRTAAFASTMTEGAILLQNYLTGAGFTPLASEWWHANDLEGREIAINAGITGDFFTETIYSRVPRLSHRR